VPACNPNARTQTATRCAAALVPAFVAATVAGGSARAAEWRYIPTVLVQSSHDDNLALLPADPRSVTTNSVEAAADIAARDTAFEFDFKPRLRTLRFSDNQQVDRTDPFADIDFKLRNERQSWSIGGQYARESTLSSEFENTGFVQTDVDRTQSGWSTGYVRQLGERGTYNFSAADVSVHYDKGFLSPLVDYSYRQIQTGYGRALDARSTLRIDVVAGSLSTEAWSDPVNNATLTASWAHQFSEVMLARVGLGWFAVQRKGDNTPDSGGYALSFAVERAFDEWHLTVQGGRNLQPGGYGTLVREDRVDAHAERRLSERLSLGATLVAGRMLNEDLRLASDDRRYSYATFDVRWHWRPQLTWRFGVNGRRQQYQAGPLADSTAVTVSIVYEGR
jgi:hypothetical protein